MNIQEIFTEEKYYKLKQLITVLDTVIELTYNELSKTTIEKKITEIQVYIDWAKKKRLGAWTIATQYEQSLNKVVQQDLYTVKRGDTLPNISNAFYGTHDYWKYIYTTNALTSDILTPGTDLTIPKLPKNPEKVLYEATIAYADYYEELK